MINLKTHIAPKLAEQYADMLSLDFRRRSTLLNSWHHYTTDLAQWDARLGTYIEGLKYLHLEAGAYFSYWPDSPLSRGDIFALSTFAFHSDNTDLLESCLSLMLAMPHLIAVAESVISWAPQTSTLWYSVFSNPAIRVIAISLRNDLPAEPELTEDEISRIKGFPIVTHGLVYALYKQKHPQYLEYIQQFVMSDDPYISLGALTAVLTRHLPYTGFTPETQLRALINNSSEKVRNQAAMLYLLNTDIPSKECITWLRDCSDDRRLYLKALGYSGLPANIEVLREYLGIPEYARLAAAAIVMIIGVSPESTGWQRLTPPINHAVSDVERDEGLTWPDKVEFDKWWAVNSSQFNVTGIYVAGYPATVDGMKTVLEQGCLALHPLAWLRLCHLKQRPAHELYAPAFLTHQMLR